MNFLDANPVNLEFLVVFALIFLILLDDAFAKGDATIKHLNLIIQVLNLVYFGKRLKLLVSLPSHTVLHFVDCLEDRIDYAIVEACRLHHALHLTCVLNFVQSINH